MSAAGILDALRDDPDDRVTRLVYADWLEDEGDSLRARAIRVQVQLDALPPLDPLRPALEECERDLRLTHQLAWIGPRPDSLQDWSIRGGLFDQLVFKQD